MLDLQCAYYGSPVLDLINFIMSNTHKELRDKYFNQLFFEDYYESFAKLLQLFGLSAEEQYPLHIFKQHLKQFGNFAIGMGIFGQPFNSKYSFIAEKKYEIENLERFEYYKKRFNDILDDILMYFKK